MTTKCPSNDLDMWLEYEAIKKAWKEPEAQRAWREHCRRVAGWWLVAISIAFLVLGVYCSSRTPPLERLTDEVSAAHRHNAAFMSPECSMGFGIANPGHGAQAPQRKAVCKIPYRTGTQFLADALLLIWMPLFFAGCKVVLPKDKQRFLRIPCIFIAASLLIAAYFVLNGGKLNVEISTAPFNEGRDLSRVKAGLLRDLLYSQALAALVTFIANSILGVVERSSRDEKNRDNPEGQS